MGRRTSPQVRRTRRRRLSRQFPGSVSAALAASSVVGPSAMSATPDATSLARAAPPDASPTFAFQTWILVIVGPRGWSVRRVAAPHPAGSLEASIAAAASGISDVAIVSEPVDRLSVTLATAIPRCHTFDASGHGGCTIAPRRRCCRWRPVSGFRNSLRGVRATCPDTQRRSYPLTRY